MTDEEFAKSIGATPVAPSTQMSDEDFAKSIGAEPINKADDKSQWSPLHKWWHNNVTEAGTPFEDTTGAGVKDYITAGLQTAASVPTSIADQWAEAFGADPNQGLTQAATKGIGMIMGETPQSKALYQNAGQVLSYGDPMISSMIDPINNVKLDIGNASAGPFAETKMKGKGNKVLDDLDAAQTARDTKAPTPPVPDDLQFWKDRAAQIQAEEAAKQAPPPVIHVNDVGTAADPATMDALTRSTEGITYENLPPDASIPKSEPGMQVPQDVNPRWVTDENGIPVRQGMPGELSDTGVDQKYTLPTQNASMDTEHANDMGNAIQEANGPKLGPDETYGSGNLAGPMGAPEMGMDGLAKTVSPEFNDTIRRFKTSQGGFTSGDVTNAIADLVRAGYNFLDKKITDLERVSRQPLSSIIGKLPQDVMRAVPGMAESLAGIIPKPESGEAFLQKALAEGKNTADFPKNWQSGAIMTGEKLNSSALKGVGQWLDYMTRKNDYRIKTQVKPLEQQFSTLTRKEFQELHQIAIKEMFNRKPYDHDLLEQRLSPAQMKAYDGFRKTMDQMYDYEMNQRAELGLPPVTKEEAYYASLRHGDWQHSFYDKEGRLVYHVSSTNRVAANKAVKWMKENFGDKIDWEKSGEKAKFTGSNAPTGLPRDIIGAYQQMGKFFDENSEVGTAIKDAIDKYNSDKGYTYRKADERFLNKSNIPGFEGNKPWLSDAENASAFWGSQMARLKDGFRWAHMQEALAEIKPLLSSQELIKNQPHIMEYAQKLVANQMGIRGNVLNAAENALAKAMGVSRSSLYRTSADIKTGTYLQQLGLNPGYAIATPLQGALSVAMHRYLSVEGYKHRVLNTYVKSIGDISSAMMRHTLHEMSGKDVDIPMSDLGRRALAYAEDNGVVNKNITDEYQHLGNSKILSGVKRALNPTITTPEKLGRISVYMSMVHHLADARNGLSENEVFRKAAEYTNLAMTDMNHTARPMIVDKLGVAGETSYMYHSYLFNEAHQLSLFARQAMRTKDPSALILHMGALMTLGGTLALPMVNEMDGLWNLFKDAVAKWKPDLYSKVAGLGIKGNILKADLPALVAQGVTSQVIGAALSNRFSPQFIDPGRPFSGLAAPIQEAREQSAIAKLAIDPTKRNAEQAAWVNMPPLIKGQMETHMNDFKNINRDTPDGRNPNGTQSYRRAGDINDISTDYKRTPNDELYRKLGMVSTEEYKNKSLRYINNEEQQRMLTAFEGNAKKMMTHVMDGDKEGAKYYGQKALELIPDENKLTGIINNQALRSGLTPEEMDKVKAEKMETLMKIRRVMNASK